MNDDWTGTPPDTSCWLAMHDVDDGIAMYSSCFHITSDFLSDVAGKDHLSPADAVRETIADRFEQEAVRQLDGGMTREQVIDGFLKQMEQGGPGDEELENDFLNSVLDGAEELIGIPDPAKEERD